MYIINGWKTVQSNMMIYRKVFLPTNPHFYGQTQKIWLYMYQEATYILPNFKKAQFYIQLVYKPHFGTQILLFGPFGQLRPVWKKLSPVLVILVLGMIQPSGSGSSLMKWGCKGHWGHQGCWGCRGHWGCWGSKVWKITTEDFRVLRFFEFSFILMFWKK